MLNPTTSQSRSELESSLSLAVAAETQGIQTIEKLVSQHGKPRFTGIHRTFHRLITFYADTQSVCNQLKK